MCHVKEGLTGYSNIADKYVEDTLSVLVEAYTTVQYSGHSVTDHNKNLFAFSLWKCETAPLALLQREVFLSLSLSVCIIRATTIPHISTKTAVVVFASSLSVKFATVGQYVYNLIQPNQKAY